MCVCVCAARFWRAIFWGPAMVCHGRLKAQPYDMSKTTLYHSLWHSGWGRAACVLRTHVATAYTFKWGLRSGTKMLVSASKLRDCSQKLIGFSSLGKILSLSTRAQALPWPAGGRLHTDVPADANANVCLACLPLGKLHAGLYCICCSFLATTSQSEAHAGPEVPQRPLLPPPHSRYAKCGSAGLQPPAAQDSQGKCCCLAM